MNIRRCASLAGTLLIAAACKQEAAEDSMSKETIQEKPSSREMLENRPVSAVADKVVLHPALQKYVKAMLPTVEQVPDERKLQLKKIALFVESKLKANEPANLVFICTHNSRRSHMGQLWAAAAAAHYGLDGVKTFSGGTEATAFNPRAVAALERAGFQIDERGGDNPRYKVSFARNAPVQEAFSKKYDDASNPSDNFVAIMTCTEADKNCPTVEGAALRVPIPYIDPKLSDGTPEEAITYDERAQHIATEMFYLFSQVRTS